MPVSIRPLTEDDFDRWQALWNQNNQGHINLEVTKVTWQRLLTPESMVGGFGAFDGTDMAGLVHYILHPVTGHIKPVCYMQDLFVAPLHRRKGVGRALVEQLAVTGKSEKWVRLYWLAEAGNAEAQALYKNLGFKIDFTLHVLPL
jgi:ribosomal protein S18 acetylase RimI-like enzyme